MIQPSKVRYIHTIRPSSSISLHYTRPSSSILLHPYQKYATSIPFAFHPQFPAQSTYLASTSTCMSHERYLPLLQQYKFNCMQALGHTHKHAHTHTQTQTHTTHTHLLKQFIYCMLTVNTHLLLHSIPPLPPSLSPPLWTSPSVHRPCLPFALCWLLLFKTGKCRVSGL